MDRTVGQWCGGGRLKCAHYIKKQFSIGPFLHFVLRINVKEKCFLFEGEKDFFPLKDLCYF